MKNFGENLKQERTNCGMTQIEFAKKIGTTQQRVSEWECNKVEPSLYNIVAILNTLNISFEDLVDGVERT